MGNVVANQSIEMQLTIISGSPSGNTEYTETHQPTTDDNGIVIAFIGEGNPVNDDFFSDINWREDDHFLKILTLN